MKKGTRTSAWPLNELLPRDLLSRCWFSFHFLSVCEAFYLALKLPIHSHQRQERMRTGPKFSSTNRAINGVVGQNGPHHPSQLSPRAVAAVMLQLLHIHLRMSQPKGWMYFFVFLFFVGKHNFSSCTNNLFSTHHWISGSIYCFGNTCPYLLKKMVVGQIGARLSWLGWLTALHLCAIFIIHKNYPSKWRPSIEHYCW